MRLFLLTVLTMIAFAANSVLNRMALASGDMDVVSFGVIRLVSGAFALALLVLLQRRGFALGGRGRVWAVAALLTYLFGFSLAYDVLDPGFGALILFGVVQVTMFAGALLSRDAMPVTRWIGAVLAMGGLAWLLWPVDGTTASGLHVLAMAFAGVGWGIYSLLGRGAKDPLQATAMNFILAAPVGLVLTAVSGDLSVPAYGASLAILSGVVTSGLGYALWYRILPELGASRAAVAQLSVPVIALAGGMVFLNEALTLRFALAATLVIAGVVISLRKT
ncbi:DMT family transporter [uncultured Shimia sp.]|uniref:DMT family transporter n=1 Tax=uncultured Shimia sp. TaxID=573152 RepID=UPI0026049FB8|nr:DMT family transporter [uncultured Shimia sp.]